jgi:hypothetical protein
MPTTVSGATLAAHWWASASAATTDSVPDI